jgi:hypothetical protein
MSAMLTSALAIAAVVISLLSLCVSTWVAARDRSRLRVRAKFWPDSEDGGEAHTRIVIKNKGRRPHHIAAWIARTDEDWISSHALGENGPGIDLDGGRSFEVVLDGGNLEEESPDGKAHIKTVWFEDGLSRRFSSMSVRLGIWRLRQAYGIDLPSWWQFRQRLQIMRMRRNKHMSTT